MFDAVSKFWTRIQAAMNDLDKELDVELDAAAADPEATKETTTKEYTRPDGTHVTEKTTIRRFTIKR